MSSAALSPHLTSPSLIKKRLLLTPHDSPFTPHSFLT